MLKGTISLGFRLPKHENLKNLVYPKPIKNCWPFIAGSILQNNKDKLC